MDMVGSNLIMFYSPGWQGPWFMRPGEQERDVPMLDHGGADAVCEARQLLQAVAVEPPVPRQVDDLLHVEDGQTQVLAVVAGGAELKDSKPGQGVNDVDHVENHRRENFDVCVVE